VTNPSSNISGIPPSSGDAEAGANITEPSNDDSLFPGALSLNFQIRVCFKGNRLFVFVQRCHLKQTLQITSVSVGMLPGRNVMSSSRISLLAVAQAFVSVQMSAQETLLKSRRSHWRTSMSQLISNALLYCFFAVWQWFSLCFFDTKSISAPVLVAK
jgi:hypothetical protein